MADLDGILVEVNDNDKVLYHAAACVASNYFVATYHYAENLMEKAGIAEGQARQALLPLVKGTLKNIEALGLIGALTGPIARGDIGTVKKHLQILEEKIPENDELYKALGKYTTDVAREKGTIDRQKQIELLTVLGGRPDDEG